MSERLTLRNTSPGERTIHDPWHRPLVFKPGEQRTVRVTEAMAEHLARRDDLVIVDPLDEFVNGQTMNGALAVTPGAYRQSLVVMGMQGLGDNIHHRAIIRELMREHDVTLATCHGTLYHDLVARGLKLALRRSQLRTQAKTQAREKALLAAPLPKGARSVTIWSGAVKAYGSGLAAMFASVGLTMPERPDFSLPVPQEWRKALRERLPSAAKRRPIMVHRPVVLRREWDGRSRNPLPAVYHELYSAIRSHFFVVSCADLEPGAEWVDGPPYQEADLLFHRGELHFPQLAALWAEAALVFASPGFAPILAQAVGTPSVTVFGGRESSRTTNWVGAHLAPTLMIDPDRPCDCYSHVHKCDKRISLKPAVERLTAFVGRVLGGSPMSVPPMPPPEPKPRPRPSAAAGKPVSTAIVVGGSAAVMEELAEAVKLCEAAGVRPALIVINDTIPIVAGDIVAATLHHHQLSAWLNARAANGFPRPFEIWGYWRPKLDQQVLTHVTADWQGSGGLFGVAVAFQRKHERIILAGVPMEAAASHIVRQRPWNDVHRYRKAWDERHSQLAGRVRSMSGWTAAKLGEPDVEWLIS